MNAQKAPLLRSLTVIIVAVAYFIPRLILAQGNASEVTNGGVDFSLCFMQNEAPGSDPSSNRYQDIFLASTGDTSTVTLTCLAFPKWKHIEHLGAGEAVTYRLSTDSMIVSYGGDVTIETSGVVDHGVIRVAATSPITCYGMNHKQYTCDAFLGLPREVASTEYIIMAYANSPLGAAENMPSEFSFSTFDDSTTITIFPTALTQDGNPIGKPLTYLIPNAYECVQIQSDPAYVGGDLTGSIVRSDKPIAVYGGSARTEVPSGYSYNDMGNSRTTRDHLAEQLPTLSTWGTKYIAKNFGRPAGDVVRVLAQSDNTVVTINGTVWGVPLMARQYRDTLIDQSDIPIKNIVIVEGSAPILVGEFAHSTATQNENGDPFFAVVPSVDQTYHDYTYFISTDKVNFDFTTQYVTIVTEVSGAGAITIDGSVVPKDAYVILPTLVGGKQYAVATVSQGPGAHRAVSPNSDENGFTLLAYGFGTVDSYGYTAGALLKPLTGLLELAPPQGSAQGMLSMRNILTEKIFFDSARVQYSYNPGNVNVTANMNIGTDIKFIDMAESKSVQVSAPSEVGYVVKGSLRVYYHSNKWHNLAPVDLPFAINTLSSVSSSTAARYQLSAYPNPATGKTTIFLSIPSRTRITLSIYDELGRNIRVVSQGMLTEGDHGFQVNTAGLPTGSHRIELLAPEIGVRESLQLIVTE